MESCEQTAGQTIRQHGESVWESFTIFLNEDYIKVPDFIIEKREELLANIHPLGVIEKYTKFHDCGKPYCLVVDENGKRHFPNHAEVSKEVWLEHFPDETLVGELIGLDMVFHTFKYEQIANLELDEKTINTLILVAYCEINSNARMFGGITSDSFKIKYKRLTSLAKKFLC